MPLDLRTRFALESSAFHERWPDSAPAQARRRTLDLDDEARDLRRQLNAERDRTPDYTHPISGDESPELLRALGLLEDCLPYIVGDAPEVAGLRRAIRRRPGMHLLDPKGRRGQIVKLRQRAGDELRVCWEDGGYWQPTPEEWATYQPDIADPLTVFGLLLLAREAWGDPSLTPVPIDESIPLQWDWCDDGLAAPALGYGIYDRRFDSEADAIVAAIIAAAEALPQ